MDTEECREMNSEEAVAGFLRLFTIGRGQRTKNGMTKPFFSVSYHEYNITEQFKNPIYKNNFNTQMEKLLVELNKFLKIKKILIKLIKYNYN